MRKKAISMNRESKGWLTMMENISRTVVMNGKQMKVKAGHHLAHRPNNNRPDGEIESSEKDEKVVDGERCTPMIAHVTKGNHKCT